MPGAGITSPAYPGERLVACRNPYLAAERDRNRRALLAVTEKALQRITRDVARRSQKILAAGEIGLKVGRVIHRHKMAKHFRVEIGDGRLTWTRDEESIARESALDGISVIRTSEARQSLTAEDTVRTDKRWHRSCLMMKN
jgi:hypothetical protein